MNHLTENEKEDAAQIFPLTIYNASGATYAVGSKEALDYHLVNGWSLEKPDPLAVIKENIGEVQQSDMVSLAARLQLLEDVVAGIEKRTGGDRTAELLKTHGSILAKLQKAVLKAEDKPAAPE